MKKRMAQILACGIAASMLLAGCGAKDAGAPAEAAPADAAVSAADEALSAAGEDLSAEPEGPAMIDPTTAPVVEVENVGVIDYANVDFDFTDDIAADKEKTPLVPAAADIAIAVADENGATGVQIQPAVEDNGTDYYLNAMVAGNAITISANDGEIASVNSSASGDIEVNGGSASVVPATLNAMNPEDEIITVTMADGTEYKIHTVNECMPIMTITDMNVDEANAGVYTFAVDKFLLRVNTDGELVYYRNVGVIGENQVENFAPQGDGYTYFAELNLKYRQANGGYSSGMYVVMDEYYVETEEVTLLPNTEENHVHGEGYLDQHEMVVMGPNHYLTLSYTPELVSNVPDCMDVLEDGTAWVWACIFQEVKDGQVIKEISTTDYPFLYQSAVEKFDYANSTDQGVTVVVGQNEVDSWADGIMDYVHVNSLDYTLAADGTVDDLLVSMRDQSAVYQFDMATGEVEWILGGKASTLTGYEDFTTPRLDEMNNGFQALTFGQHYARYTNKSADGTIEGPVEISVFDNQTGMAPFITAVPIPTLTRTFKATIDEDAQTATVSNVINGTDLNQMTDKYHIASHCGSVDYINDNSVVIGWGLHAVVDSIPPMAPEGTISDMGYDDLRMGSRPIFTEYDEANGAITFELSVNRNPLVQSHEGLFSYRTYKTAE